MRWTEVMNEGPSNGFNEVLDWISHGLKQSGAAKSIQLSPRPETSEIVIRDQFSGDRLAKVTLSDDYNRHRPTVDVTSFDKRESGANGVEINQAVKMITGLVSLKTQDNENHGGFDYKAWKHQQD